MRWGLARAGAILLVALFVALHAALKVVTGGARGAVPEPGGLGARLAWPSLERGGDASWRLARRLDVPKGAYPRVVALFESWCGACGTELGALDALARRRAGEGLAVFGVYATSSDASVAALRGTLGLTLPLVRVDAGDYLRAAGEDGIPVVLVFGDDQRLLRRFVGLDLELVPFLEALLDRRRSR